MAVCIVQVGEGGLFVWCKKGGWVCMYGVRRGLYVWCKEGGGLYVWCKEGGSVRMV